MTSTTIEITPIRRNPSEIQVNTKAGPEPPAIGGTQSARRNPYEIQVNTKTD